MKQYLTASLVAGLSVAPLVNAQEAAAAGDMVRTDTNAIAIQMDAKNTAMMAVLQKLTTCNALGSFYRPGQPGADANGCVSSGSSANRTFVEYKNSTNKSTMYLDHDSCSLSDVLFSPSPGLNTGSLAYACELTPPGSYSVRTKSTATVWQLFYQRSGMSGAICKAVCMDF
jgi:hypothetical protein